MRFAWMMLCVACGAPSGHFVEHDAATGADSMSDGAQLMSDAAIDVALPDIPAAYECDVTQPGNVTVRTNGANVPLLIHDVFGTLVARTTSGTTGLTTVTVPGCGAVTAVHLSVQPLVHTVTFVRDGDVLFIDIPPDLFGVAPSGPAHLYVDAASTPNSSFIVGATATLAASSQPNIYDLYWSQRLTDAQGLATVAVHDAGLVNKYQVFENVDLTTAIQTPLHVTSWRTTMTDHMFQVTLPEPLSVDFGAMVVAKGVTHLPVYGPAQSAATVHDYSLSLPSYGEGVFVRGLFYAAGSQATRSYLEVFDTTAGTRNLDLTSELLPTISSVTVSSAPARPSATWTLATSASSHAADLTVLRVRGAYEWRFSLPPGTTSYQLPELPSDLAQDFSTATFSVSLFEGSAYAGYAAARGRFVELFSAGRYSVGTVVRRSASDSDAL